MPLNERSRKNLVGVHPDLVRVVERAAEISSVPIVVTEGLRNLDRQKQLVAAGKSWTIDSRHLTGHAIDVVDANDFKYDIPDMDHIAKAMKQAAAELKVPIVWGGDWKQRDTPHFELDRKAYPASGVGITTKAREIATKVMTSKPVLTTTGIAGGAVATDSTPVSAPSIPSPPDLSVWLSWKTFGQTVADLGSWALAHPLLTVALAGFITILAFPQLIPEKWRPQS
jgi:peptidoglycan L-alanyl-D-glutamate endopeptidase CwlK